MSAPDLPKKKVVLLGSTGSIGTSTLKVAQDIPDRMELVGLAAHSSVESLAAQVAETGVKRVALGDESRVEELRALIPDDVEILGGEQGLVDLVAGSDADMLLVAIVGTAGLRPALAGIEAGMDLAVASKEILVMAGEKFMEAAREKGVAVLPVDSEHNAIFQCLEGHSPENVGKLILTASGGPFRTAPASDLAGVDVARALAHPTWEMGRKISIDSATLFNKGLEMIEARWLFDVEMDRVDVVVHPQSIVHSMIEFVDGSVLAQLSHSDMCFPIQYAVTWPHRVANTLEPLDFAQLSRLDFEAPRYDDFPSLTLAREAGEKGGALPAIMNAANEVAVDAFLGEKISFPAIWETVAEVMSRHQGGGEREIDELVAADQWARGEALGIVG